MPRAKKVEPVNAEDIVGEWVAEVRPAPEHTAYELAVLASTQLTVSPHDDDAVIDMRIDRALMIANRLLNKAKEIK